MTKNEGRRAPLRPHQGEPLIPCRAIPILLALAAAGLGGCTAPVIVASAAVTGVQYGTEAFVRGDLESAQIATMEEVYDATDKVIAELEFIVAGRRFGKNSAWIKFREINGRPVTIDFERRTPRVTKTTIRVGVWGDQAISRLLLAEIQARLPATPMPETITDH